MRIHPPVQLVGAQRVAGFTMLEVLIALTVLAIAVAGLLASTVAGSTLGQVHRESSIANSAVRQAVETMQNTPIETIYATFSDPANANFAVPGLALQELDADGFAGQIEFPWPGPEVREDADAPAWGLPLDLNADGDIDAADHSGDYALLPVRVRVDWAGVTGDRSIQVHTFLSAR